MSARTQSVSVSLLASLSADQRLHRAFDHLIAATPGSLLLCPVWLSAGDLSSVIDGCPVPWDEIDGVLADPPDGVRPLGPAEALSAATGIAPLILLFPWGWRDETFRLPLHHKPLRRLVHESGLRYAMAGGGESRRGFDAR